MMRTVFRQKNEDGLTLVELIAAIGIAILLSSIALVAYTQVRKNAQITAVETALETTAVAIYSTKKGNDFTIDVEANDPNGVMTSGSIHAVPHIPSEYKDGTGDVIFDLVGRNHSERLLKLQAHAKGQSVEASARCLILDERLGNSKILEEECPANINRSMLQW